MPPAATRARMAFIGSSEAPITPEVMEGYMAMGALATDKGLRLLDGLPDSQIPDHRRACRPFAENCGFTITESSQMVVLFDDQLALELGATIYAAASDVFGNADGHKKSIAGPTSRQIRKPCNTASSTPKDSAGTMPPVPCSVPPSPAR